MKRMHVHVGVEDLHRAIGFYSALFATQPAVVKPDYAKWMLDDPRVNFAISTRGKQPGLDHLGIQVESQDELQEVYKQAAMSSSRATPLVVTRSRKSRGSTIRPASRGKPFSQRARARTTATGPGRVTRASRTKRYAASRKLPRYPRRKRRRLAVRHRTGHGRSLQRPVPVHRQLGALDHGRGDPEQARCR